MRDTNLNTTPENLIETIKRLAVPATHDLIASEFDKCETISEKAEWCMECYYSFVQKYAIVKIVETGTWGLIIERDGDNEEYINLSNDGKIKEWHE